MPAPAHLELRPLDGLLPGGRVRLHHPSGASVEIAPFGAHVLSWTTPSVADAAADSTPPPPVVERLWMSRLSAMDGSAPIRGGIPIAWPQFADVGGMPLHGFARERVWTVAETTAPAPGKGGHGGFGPATVTFALRADEDTTNGTWRSPATEPFPYKFELRYTVSLGAKSLRLRLEARHLADSPAPGPMPFTGCLHTYFRTADSSQVLIKGGLEGVPFVDKVDGMKTKTHKSDSMRLAESAHESGGYTDRVYTPGDGARAKGEPAAKKARGEGPARAPWATALHCGPGLDAGAPSARTQYAVSCSGDWPDVVIFNPWETGKLGDKGPDFDDDGYRSMVCVEPCVASAPAQVAKGAQWAGECNVDIVE